jgi:hypothetical protein
MAAVIGWTLVGGAYRRGHYIPGWDVVKLDDGTQYNVYGNKTAVNGLLEDADKRGHDTKRMRERTAEWVKTGKMPPHEEAAPV